jgi:hypothetical protein
LAFVVDEKNGTWGNAQPIPGLATLTTRSFAWADNISCGAIGDCTVAGAYGAGPHMLPFTATETNGTWGNASELPGVPAADTDAIARTALSCPATRDCTLAVDYYVLMPALNPLGVFTATEHNGTWGKPQAIPGLPSPGSNQGAYVGGLSCSTAGNCGAGGYYLNAARWPSFPGAFVASEVNGTWGRAHHVTVPGIGGDNGQVTAISCPAAGYCGAAIFKSDLVAHRPQVQEAFVVNEATASATKLTVSTAKLAYGHESAEHLTITVTGRGSVAPSGKVTVNAGKATICRIILRAGKGSCRLTPTQLKPGTYHLTASYTGSAGYLSSTSPARTLTIAR